MLAVELGHNFVAKLLLEHGANVHTRGPFGATAVYRGALVGNVEMIAALVGAGGDVNVADARGASPIWIGKSTESGHQRM
jgi:ankyrin repeat protein